MDRPSPFKILDALTFGLVALVVTGFAVRVQLTPQSLQAHAIMWVTAAAFWAIYACLVHARAALLAQYPLTLLAGILVDPENYQTRTDTLNKEVQRVVDLYTKAGIENSAMLLLKDTVWLKFRPGPFPHPQIQGLKVMGFMTAGGEGGEVAYTSTTEPVEKTAFAHELGHVILGRTWNDWNEDRHHAFMREHGLP